MTFLKPNRMGYLCMDHSS